MCKANALPLVLLLRPLWLLLIEYYFFVGEAYGYTSGTQAHCVIPGNGIADASPMLVLCSAF